jgi:outer membrane protein TolC
MVLLQVQKAVFTANESTKKVALSKENLKIAEENLRITTDAFAEGMVKTTDVLEAQALWFDAYSSLIDGQMENQLSIVNLKKVMGKSDYK